MRRLQGQWAWREEGSHGLDETRIYISPRDRDCTRRPSPETIPPKPLLPSRATTPTAEAPTPRPGCATGATMIAAPGLPCTPTVRQGRLNPRVVAVGYIKRSPTAVMVVVVARNRSSSRMSVVRSKQCPRTCWNTSRTGSPTSSWVSGQIPIRSRSSLSGHSAHPAARPRRRRWWRRSKSPRRMFP